MNVLRFAHILIAFVVSRNHPRGVHGGNHLEKIAIQEYRDRGTTYCNEMWELISSLLQNDTTVSIVVDSFARRFERRHHELVRRLQEEAMKSVIVRVYDGSSNAEPYPGSDLDRYEATACILVIGEVGPNSSFLVKINGCRFLTTDRPRLLIFRHVDCPADDSEGIFDEAITSYSIHFVMIVDSHGECALAYNYVTGEVFRYALSEKQRIMDFLVRRYKNLGGIPLRVSMFPNVPVAIPQPNSSKFLGIDGFMLDTFAGAMNFTPALNGPEDGETFGVNPENGTATGSLGQVVRKEVELSMNMRFTEEQITDLNVESTLPAFEQSLCFVVAKAKRMPIWLNMYRVFDIVTCTIVLLVFVIVTIVWLAILKYTRKSHAGSVIGKVCADVFALVVAGPVQRRSSAHSERLLIVSCLILAMILTNIFQGRLIDRFRGTAYYSEINTLAELADSDLLIKIGSDYQHFVEEFRLSENPVINGLANKMVVEENRVYWDAAEYEEVIVNHAILSTVIRAHFVIRQSYEKNNGTALLHIVEEFPTLQSMGYIVPRGSPLLSEFNKYISRIVRAGLASKWYKDAMYNSSMFVERSEAMSESERTSLKAFQLRDLQLPIYILISGWIISCVTFLVEIYRCPRDEHAATPWEIHSTPRVSGGVSNAPRKPRIYLRE